MSHIYPDKFHYDICLPNHWENLMWMLQVGSHERLSALGVPTLSFSGLVEEFRGRESELKPCLTECMVDHPFRLGKYCEKLMSFAFEKSTSIELLASGLQIQDKGRTLGEMDFIIELDGRERVHVEMAVKFYLEAAPEVFVGPALHDTLATKVRQLLSRQLCLSQTNIAKACLRASGIDISRSAAFMPMRLFSKRIDAQPVSEVWVAESKLDWQNVDGAIVPRLCWPSADLSKSRLDEAIDYRARFLDGGGQPMLVNDSKGLQFVVSDDWEDRARKLTEK